MVHSKEHQATAVRVQMFRLGWRKGSTGSAYTPEMMADADFKRGHDEARAASSAAARAFCAELGHDAMLDVLR